MEVGTLLCGDVCQRQSVMDCQQRSYLIGSALDDLLDTEHRYGWSHPTAGGHANDRLGGYEVELAATCRASCPRLMSAQEQEKEVRYRA